MHYGVEIMSSNKFAFFVSVALVILCLQCLITEAQLQVGYYDDVCALAEIIVKQQVRDGFINDMGVAAGLLRLHFHDCFVRGCDASVLLDSTPSNVAEKDSPANNPSLRGFEVIDKAKAVLEAICPGTVSCADILAFAARDSIEISGGLGYDVPAGRRDGRVSLVAETRDLPAPIFDVNQLTSLFSSKGLTQEDMVTLSGAHTIGRSHCTTVIPRLYNFSTSTTQDPSIDPLYATVIKQQCPQTSDPSLVVPMNPSTPMLFDVGYYDDVANNRGLFGSDQALMEDPSTVNQVQQYLSSPSGWRSKFALAMVKMGQIGVLTGTSGEIRYNCRQVN